MAAAGLLNIYTAAANELLTHGRRGASKCLGCAATFEPSNNHITILLCVAPQIK